jgi:hypothetical protein
LINNSLIRKLVRVEYSLLRAPLATVNQRIVVRRFAEDSPVRLAVARALGVGDARVGQLIDDPELRQRGDALRHHSQLNARAAQLDGEAKDLRSEADHTQEQAEAQADEDREQAQQDEFARVAEALLAERQQEQTVGELADADEAEKKRQAELRAKHLVEEHEEERRTKQARIRRQKEAATAPAKAQLRDAAQTKAAATSRRKQADMLSDAATAESQTRDAPR